jgi:hypothetical protein
LQGVERFGDQPQKLKLRDFGVKLKGTRKPGEAAHAEPGCCRSIKAALPCKTVERFGAKRQK